MNILGRVLGKALAAPVRLVNIPVKLSQDAMDVMCGDTPPRRRRNGLDHVARVIEEETAEALGDDEGGRR